MPFICSMRGCFLRKKNISVSSVIEYCVYIAFQWFHKTKYFTICSKVSRVLRSPRRATQGREQRESLW